MAKALRVVAVVAGATALIATGLGAVGVGTVLGVKTATIAAIAGGVGAVASTGAQLLQPKPIARGSPAQVTIDIEPPRPYVVGEVMVGGVIRYDSAYGPTIKKVPNPYRWQVRVLSGVGPIQAILSDYFDFAPINTGFYNSSFLRISRQLGNRPEASALAPQLAAGAPGWGASARLSGCAAVGLNMLFDRDGERYSSGVPIYTALVQGEKVYDPRQDSTFPGGSGPCRAGVESTYVYSRNPAAHAVTYALGRFQNGLRLYGLGQSVDAIDMPAIVDWANDCDANGWTVNMVLTEGGTGANLREQRVRNLDDLCAAGGGRWYQAGGLLSFDWHRPRLSLATLTDEDILLAGGGTDAVQTVRDRMNGVRPQYVSPAHNWQQITAAEIVGSTYRTEDGAPLTQVYPLNGVTNAEQAGELAAYAMTDSRELGPMDIQAKAKWRFYRPGDCITVDSSLVAYQGQAVINQRGLNPETFDVALSLKSETPGKHDFALGKVANPPPTPVLAQTAEERDLLAAAALAPRFIDAEPGSTRNQDGGGNLIGTAIGFEGATYINGAGQATVNGQPAAQLQGGSFSAVIWSDWFPVRGGERLFFSYQAHSDVSNPDSIRAGYNWRDAAGNITPNDLPDTALLGTAAVGLGNTATRTQSGAIPGAAVAVQFFVTRPTWGGSGSFFVRRPLVSRAQPGATDGAPAGSLVGGVESSALVTQANNAASNAIAAYRPRQNLVFNGRLRLGKYGWEEVSGVWIFSRNSAGQFVEQPYNTGGTFVLRSQRPIFSGAGAPMVISLQGFANNAGPSQGIFADIEWRNGANDTVLGFSSSINGNGAGIFTNVPAGNPAYNSQAIIAPSPTDGSGFVRGFVRIVSVGTAAYLSGGHAALGVKVEAGTTPSAISDEATDGAVLDNTFGRIRDPEAYNTQAILGPRNTTNLVPTYSANPSNVTVLLPAHPRNIATRTGPRTLNYGASSGVVAFSAYWAAYIDDPELTGFVSPAVVFTSNPNDLLFPGRYQIASGVAPGSGGTGGSTGPGGGTPPPPLGPGEVYP